MYLSNEEVQQLKAYIGQLPTASGYSLFQFFLMKEEQEAQEKEIADALKKLDAEQELAEEKKANDVSEAQEPKMEVVNETND